MPGADRFAKSLHHFRTLRGKVVVLVWIVPEIEQENGRLVPNMHVAVFRGVFAMIADE